MRIQQLSLDFFGKFTGHSFDFDEAANPSDFHIIYGANEAGKTTAMEGFLRLLYGFPSRDPYDYQHQRKNLSVSGILQLDGEPQNFTRLSKRSGNLLGEASIALSEKALEAHLGGLTIEDYRSLLCLDDNTIEKGGEDIANARGDIGSLLFSAAAGVADLSTVLEKAREEVNGLYRKHASKTQMAGLKKNLDEVNRQIREGDITASGWHKLKQVLQTAKGKEDEARSARKALEVQQAEVAALRRALPLLGDLDRLEKEVADFANYPDKIDNIDPEDLVVLKTDQSKAEGDITRLEEEIKKAKKECAGLDLNPDRLALAQALDDLDNLRSRMATAEGDLPRRRQELQAAEKKMASTARDLCAPEGIDLVNLVVPVDKIDALESARDAMHKSAADRDAEEREVVDLRARVAKATETLDDLQTNALAQRDFAGILAQFDADNLASKFAAAREAIDTSKEQLAEALDTLGYGSQTFSTPPSSPIDVAMAEQLASQYTKLTQQIERVEEKLTSHRNTIEARVAQIDFLTAIEGVESDADAREARDNRARLWKAHREDLTEVTADAFEPTMIRVDEVAENRLAHARELGELRQLEKARIESETQEKQENTQLGKLKTEANKIKSQVEGIAKTLNFPTMTPATLLVWTQNHVVADKAFRKHNRLVEKHQPVLDRADSLRDSLRPLLQLEYLDFVATLAEARRLANDERVRQEETASADKVLKNLKKDLMQRQSALAELSEKAEQQLGSWGTSVSKLFREALDPKILDDRLSLLRELREHETERSRVEHQVSTMEADQCQFDKAMTKLITLHDLPKSNPLEMFDVLRNLAKQATAAQDRYDALTAKIEKKTELLDNAKYQLEEIARQVCKFGTIFPETVATGTLDALRTAVGITQRTIATRTQIAKLEQQILSDLSVPNLEAARSLLENTTTAKLEAEAGMHQTDLKQAETFLSECTAARATAERDLAVITGDAGIATLVEDKETLELQLEETALDYLERNFGLSLAEEAIRRYRDTHRSGMMEATERAFIDLTNGAYTRLRTQSDGTSETLLAIDANGSAKQVGDMSKGTRFQLYFALRAAAYEQLVSQGIQLPFFCDDIFETFDEDRTRAACLLMERIGKSGQAIYLTHHRHVVKIACDSCVNKPTIHNF